MLTKKTIVITGNHHTPATELISLLTQDTKIHWKIIYLSQLLTHETHLSNAIIPNKNVIFHNIVSGKYHRKSLLTSIIGIPKTLFSIYESYKIIKKYKPNITVSFGGYSSVPVIIASKILGINSITHEQTNTISLSTKINSYFVNIVALSFNPPQNSYRLPANKLVVTGNLLRHQIFQNNQPSFLPKNYTLKTPLIYITGGNQGSHYINQVVQKTLPKLKKYFVIHQTGPLEQSKATKTANYCPVNYVSSTDIGWIFHHTQVIISRSGANTCQEIYAYKLPSILIPLPHAQQNEQFQNAKWLKSLLPKITKIIPQKRFNSISLLKAIKELDSKKVATNPQKNNPELFVKLINELAS